MDYVGVKHVKIAEHRSSLLDELVLREIYKRIAEMDFWSLPQVTCISASDLPWLSIDVTHAGRRKIVRSTWILEESRYPHAEIRGFDVMIRLSDLADEITGLTGASRWVESP
jgi:hypothetical protein